MVQSVLEAGQQAKRVGLNDMIDDSISLPFRIPHLYAGFAEIRGILKGGKEGLVLDFELKESLFNLLRLDSNVVRIPLVDIATVELKKGWLRRWIIINANRLEALRQVPGSRAGEVRLRIARKNTATAEELVSRIQMALTTYGLKKLISTAE